MCLNGFEESKNSTSRSKKSQLMLISLNVIWNFAVTSLSVGTGRLRIRICYKQLLFMYGAWNYKTNCCKLTCFSLTEQWRYSRRKWHPDPLCRHKGFTAGTDCITRLVRYQLYEFLLDRSVWKLADVCAKRAFSCKKFNFFSPRSLTSSGSALAWFPGSGTNLRSKAASGSGFALTPIRIQNTGFQVSF